MGYIERRKTREVKIGNVTIGGDNPIAIQSMCNTKTSDVKATVAQILALEKAGCEIIRVAVPDMEAALAIKEIKKQIHIPLVADIHFDYKLALQAIESGVDKLRINPGNIGGEDRVKAVVMAAKEKHIPIRIGVNSGSLEKHILENENGNIISEGRFGTSARSGEKKLFTNIEIPELKAKKIKLILKNQDNKIIYTGTNSL